MTIQHRLFAALALLCLLGCCASAQDSTLSFSDYSLNASSTSPEMALLAAAPRWWDDMVQWVRSLGWDRGRLVQMWLFFMLIGLYIILRIKPRA